MKRIICSLFVWTILAFALSSCGGTSTTPAALPQPTVDVAAVQTKAAQDVIAQLTANAPTTTPTPAATPTPQIPTDTPTPQNTSTPEPTSTPQVGTFSNPVPIKTGYHFPGLGTLTVEKSLWKPKQTGFAVVYLSFTCERPADQECDAGDFMFDSVGKSGNGYKQEFDTAIPEPTFGSFMNPPVFGGGTEKGYAGFLVTNPEESLIMKVGQFLKDGDVYFKISD